jgi:hypothetical protein
MADSGRALIIQQVRTPIAFFTLVVLVTEAILAALAVRVTGLNLTLLLVGMILLLFALVLAVVLTRHTRAALEDADVTKRKYDVFLASVLAGFDDDTRLLTERKAALAIATTLEQECRFTVYYAGRDVRSTKDFDASHLGAKEDLEALRDSRHFIMLFPQKVTSSVLFEAGYAFQRCETSTYFVHNRNDLPYLMRRLPEVHSSFVRILTYEDAADVIRLIKTRREQLFSWAD